MSFVSSSDSIPSFGPDKISFDNLATLIPVIEDRLSAYGTAGTEILTNTRIMWETLIAAHDTADDAPARSRALAERKVERIEAKRDKHVEFAGKLIAFLAYNTDPLVLEKLRINPLFLAARNKADSLSYWGLWKRALLQVGTNSLSRLEQRWRNVHQGSQSYAAFIAEFDTLWHNIDYYREAENQPKLTDATKVSQLLSVVTSGRYESLTTPMEATGKTAAGLVPTYADFREDLRRLDEAISARESDIDTNKALLVKQAHVSTKRSSSHHSSPTASSSQVIVCHNCGEQGHKSPQCTRPKVTCGYKGCLRQGHMTKFCQTKRHEQKSSTESTKSSSSAPFKKARVEAPREKSNLARETDSKVDEAFKSIFDEGEIPESDDDLEVTRNLGNMAFVAETVESTDSTPEANVAYVVTVYEIFPEIQCVDRAYAAEPTPRFDNLDICIDSGASVNVFRNELLFEYIPGRKVMSYSALTGISGQDLVVKYTHMSKSIGKTLYCPRAESNLLSVRQMANCGYRFSFMGSFVLITSPSGEKSRISTGTTGLYWINLVDLLKLLRLNIETANVGADSSMPSLTATATTATTETVTTAGGIEVSYSVEQKHRARLAWSIHHALGHPGYSSLSKSFDAGVILGCRITSADLKLAYVLFGKCSHCQAGKITKISFKPSLNPPASMVGERVHVDIWPLSVTSLGGAKYVLVGVDEFSGFLTVGKLISKSQTSLEEALASLFSMYKRYKHEVGSIITDSESNFGACDTFIGLHGAIPKQIPPYQHAQRIERYVRTINDRVRTILDSLTYELPAELDLELLFAVVDQLNCLSNTLHPTMTPNILVKGTKLDLRDTIPPAFGTPAMFHHPGRQQQKKVTRSTLGIVLGRDTTSDNTTRSVRAYIISTGDVLIRNQYDLYDNLPDDVKWKRKSVSRLALTTAGRTTNRDMLKNRFISTDTVTGIQTNTITSADMLNELNTSVDMDNSPNTIAQSRSITTSFTPTTMDAPVRANTPSVAATTRTHDSTTEILDSIVNTTSIIDNSEHDDAISENAESYVDTYHGDPGSQVDTDTSGQAADASSTSVTGDGMYDYIKSRSRKRRLHDDSEGYCAYELPIGYKLSVKSALQGVNSAQCRAAIIDEIKNWMDFKVGHPVKSVHPSQWKNVLHSFMFLKEKYKPDGRHDKTKARLVVDGKHQDGHLYDLISSTTVNIAAVFMLLNIASFYKARIVTYDIKGAFLHADFDHQEPIFVRIPHEVTNIWLELDPSLQEYVNSKGDLILELDKYVYGLKQSPLKFQLHLRSTLLSLGYHQLESDDCIFIKVTENSLSIISTHVDDILQVSTTDEAIDELHKGLINVYNEVTYTANADSYLGMTIAQSTDRTTVTLSMRNSIQNLIDKYLPPNAKAVTSPACDKLFETSDDEVPISDSKSFLSIVMSLMYIARLTRPDILLAVTYLATRAQHPTETDMAKIHRVLRYLKGTTELGVTIHCEDLRLHCHCDASYGSHPNGSSHTGYVVSMGSTKSYVHARSGKQKTASLSSTDAEVIALVDCLKVVVWLRDLLQELDLGRLTPTAIYQDNKSALFMVTDTRAKYRRSKHILTKIAFARDLHREGAIEMIYCDTKSMIADVLTKPLQGAQFILLICLILGINFIAKQ